MNLKKQTRKGKEKKQKQKQEKEKENKLEKEKRNRDRKKDNKRSGNPRKPGSRQFPKPVLGSCSAR